MPLVGVVTENALMLTEHVARHREELGVVLVRRREYSDLGVPEPCLSAVLRKKRHIEKIP
jgi:hypothetical protein